MSSQSIVQLDAAIFGGGVAGLWTLARLRQAGYRAVLLEPAALGAGQTRYAQGIIHGGTKYALTGVISASANAVAAMPALWRACLEGRGEVDLRQVELMAPNQMLWSTSSLTSRMAGFFASRLMRSRTRPLGREERPEVFRHADFRGQVYELDEPVLDTATLVKALAEPHREAILAYRWPDGIRFAAGSPGTVELDDGKGNSLRLAPRRLLFAAGKGNGELLARLGRSAPRMQLRPLQMVMLRGELPAGLYAHCLGASNVPRLTISSHFDRNGVTVWYLGGQPAEEGVKRSPEAQIEATRRELAALLPWVDFAHVQWATLRVDRAEPLQEDGSRPDTAFVHEEEGVLTAWPTKLALAPTLTAEVLRHLEAAGIAPGGAQELALPTEWPRPPYAPLPWEEEEAWS